MRGRGSFLIQSRPPSEARTAIVAIIVISSLAFLLFEMRKDMIQTIRISEARLALQAASIGEPNGASTRNIVIDAPVHGSSGDRSDLFPALKGQITVALPLPLDEQKSAPFLEMLGVSGQSIEDTRGHFTIRQARLFASIRSGSTLVLTSAPLSAVTTGLLGRIAIDIAGVCFLGFLLLLVRESRLSDYSVRRLLDASPVPLILIDADGKVEFANRTALDLFPQQAPRTLESLRSRLAEHPEFNKWLIDLDTRTDLVSTKEFKVNFDGGTRYFLASRQVFIVRSRRMIIASISDISVRHEAEAALSRAKEAAESLGHMKSELLAMISHELKTPVNGILGLSQLLAAQSLPESSARIVDRLIQAGRTLAVLVNDVVDLAMLETGHFRLKHDPFNPQDTIVGAVSLASAVPGQQNIGLRVAFASPLPETAIGDPARLQQIVINLVGNSIKFTKAGSIEVRAEAVPHSAASADLVIEVSDTGIGIPAEVIPRLFQPFSQAETGHRRRFEGTGLGLAISKRLANAMGGDISVQSRVEHGSTFRVTLPLELSAESEPTRLPQSPPVRGLRVLVVDDIQINRDVVGELLAAEGCDVWSADSGKDALRICQEMDFDLILMDIRMPDMDGLAATAAIRTSWGADRARIPILGLTANPLPNDRPLFALRGIDGIVEKPVEREHLRAALARCKVAGPMPVTVIPPRLGRLRKDLGRERADRIVRMFLAVADETVEAIAERCSRLDLDGILEAAHRLCGSASNTGFDELSAAATRLETAARMRQTEKISDAALDTINAFKEAQAGAQLWLSEAADAHATNI